MSSLNTPSPVGDAASVASLTPSLSIGRSGEILKTGNLKKLKTMKKKYFVLRCESADHPARLEYYDSEKKFKTHQPPKRTISLKACFNINRRTDMKQKFVIALYTKDDCFCIVLDSEEERESWLKALWQLQDGDDVTDGETPKPVFEHVWKVEVANKGLGATRNISGQYHLCLTGKTVSLVRILSDGAKDTLEFPLQNIRSFGCLQSFFYMEVGRNAVTGTGEIWMEVEDAVIATDMKRAVNAMRGKGDDGSKPINRSASVSESSRPISVTNRRQNNSLCEKHEDGGSSMSNSHDTSSGYQDSYCEMMKGPSRFVTSDHDGSSSLNQTGSVPCNFLYCHLSQRCAQHQHQQQCRVNNNTLSHPNRRRHSVSAVSVSTPGTAACWASGCKGGPPQGSGATGAAPLLVHHQRTYSFPLSPLPPSTSVRRGSIGTKAGPRASGTGPSSAHCSSAGRDRSDSLPSSVRPPTENHGFFHGSMVPHGHPIHHSHSRNMHSHFISTHRPPSVYSRGISHSPPVGSSPVSPASGACSTDSAGSSLSIDEGDNWVDGGDVTLSSMSSRYASNHPLTPESPIEEENGDDYVHWNGPSALDSGVGDDEKVNNYMPMDRSSATLSLPIQQSVSGSCRKISPGRNNLGTNLKSGTSPSHSNYMEMNSPCGSSPLDTPGNYMIMSPGNAPDSLRNAAFYSRGIQQMHTAPNSANHSRTSSLAEETPDGYIPMMPGQTDDGYVDMDPPTADGREDFHHGEMSPTSSCSITSGTPSTDLRFSEYPLEKVNSYLTPSEEEETGERPTRCYSVGSKPDSLNKKNRLDFVNQTDCSRVRAFSVGSRNAPGSKYMSRPLGHDIHATRHTLQAGGHFTPPSQHKNQQHPGGSKKSSSAPILSNPLSSSPMSRHILGGSHSSVEPMDDLMEMDFSPSVPSGAKTNRNKNTAKSGGRAKPTPASDYMSMSPADRLSVPSGPIHHSSQSSVASSFSMAEGVDVSSHIGSPRGFETVGSGSPPKTSVLRSVYSSTVGRSPPENLARSPPSRTSATPRSAVARMSCISELKPQNFPTTTPSPPIKQSLLATNNMTSMTAKMAKMAVSSPYIEMNPSSVSSKPVIATSSASKPHSESSPYVEMKAGTTSGVPTSSGVAGSAIPKPNNLSASANNEDYLDMSFKPRRTSVPECSKTSDGYVEMGWRSSDHEGDLKLRKTSLDSQKPSSANDDYMNMSGGSLSSSRTRRERRSSTKKDRNHFRSQPINIQQPAQQSRKIPMDTPPKAPPGFLPLASSDSQSPLSSPFSSLGRNRNRKSSKDSGSSASGLTTPTGSNSTIFPFSLNSPGSPLKPFSEEPLSDVPPTASGASFDKLEKVPADMSSGTLRLSYPGVDTPKANTNTALSSKQELPKHDYVNFNPNSVEAAHSTTKSMVEDDEGDYAVMCPVGLSTSKSELQKKTSPTSTNSSSNTVSRLPINAPLGLTKVSLSNDFSKCSSKPLTVSSLLGMNNLSPTSTSSEPHNNLNLSKLLPSKQPQVGSSIKEKQLSNCDLSPSPGLAMTAENSPATQTSLEAESLAGLVDAGASPATLTSVSLTSPVAVATVVHSSPSMSPSTSPCPNPSPSSEGSTHVCPTSPTSASGGGLREKKMSSGSDSSTASRDSQLLVRKYSAGSVSPSSSGGKKEGNESNGKTSCKDASRRLSCPSKSSVSRQVSLSSDISDASQPEESRISDAGTSLSRQTSSSSASGEMSSSTLALTEKRSLSCSPVPTSASPVPRPAEREINYASLDLRTGSESEDSSTRSPRGLKTQGSLSESQSSTSSPSPNPPGGTFTYAQIDFEKSEELRLASAKNVKQ